MDSEQGGGGMSRAARKRAKKKKKQSSKSEPKKSGLDAQNQHSNVDLVDTFQNKGIDPLNEKKRKRNLKEPPSLTKLNNQDEQEGSISTKVFYPSATVLEILGLQKCKNQSLIEEMESMTATRKAACLFQAIIAPITLEEFYKDYFEKKPLVVTAASKKCKSFCSNMLSLESIKTLTRRHPMYYGRDLNVTKFRKGDDGVKRRITLDKVSEDNNCDDDMSRGVLVETSELWSNYDEGCTIRLLCPHKYNDVIQSLLSTLELEFQCMVGANAYLTPPRSSQGFAPHYDDIDAYCLQLEGSKRWKVYEPTVKLPRTSSEDFTSADLEDMKLFLDVTLDEGDLLYMPRGWIHQACTLRENNKHSLHLTVSSMQQWAWADLMEIAVPEALAAAVESNSSTSLREGLPQGFLEYMGVQYEETQTEKLPESLKQDAEEEKLDNNQVKFRSILREKFRKDAKKKIMEIAKAACEMLDASCDELGKRFLSERQPPALTTSEAMLTSKGDETADEFPLLPNTMCRLVRPGIARLVIEDDKAVIYHCFDNSREHHGNPISPMEFEMDDAAALEQLLTTVEPNWIFVNDLFHDTIEDKIQITQALYDDGIIAIKKDEEVAE
eukprot:CAMPEP_0197197532 /NCGR_PEP_ID=MMETSP1423-20130617/32915_1 /TAXON_ID=476441 /ORGANISM="Pseudo-nitzschia heimii, Strain UNC1101" /LENGTH=609 /DNA_ID=CAMNT_0042651357 /DNA_START=116 /DNA_END=1945 /DNA_ORIENTATION=+